MSKKIITAVAAIAVTALALGGCAAAPTESPNKVTAFTITSDAEIGDTDNYGNYIFNLYLETGQELSLDFYADGGAVMFSLLIPSQVKMGYNTSDGNAGNVKDIGLGSLEKNKTQAAAEGHFRYEVPETGDYIATVQSSSPQAVIDVLIEYEIN